MEWKPINSSALSGIMYDPDNNKLLVRFLTGTVYEYIDVSQEEYDSLFKGENSTGRNIMALIKLKEYQKL